MFIFFYIFAKTCITQGKVNSTSLTGRSIESHIRKLAIIPFLFQKISISSPTLIIDSIFLLFLGLGIDSDPVISKVTHEQER